METKIIKCLNCEKELEMELTGRIEGPLDYSLAYQCLNCESITSIIVNKKKEAEEIKKD